MRLVAVPDVFLPDGTVRRGELPAGGGGGEYTYEPALTAGIIPGFLSAPLPFNFMSSQFSDSSFRRSLYLDALVGMPVCRTNQVSLISGNGV